VSHAPERSEKSCLNCGATVMGRYCHVCGQENVEPKESFWHLVTHFFNDITHFDGKFFTTLKDLLFKPGFLSKEYIIGRRASYLNPVRMYVFTSAIFFLLFFSFFRNKESGVAPTINGKTLEQIDKMDSATFAKFTIHINEESDRPGKTMTREEFKAYVDTVFKIFLDTSSGFQFAGADYGSAKQFDSLQHTNAREHNWFKRQLIYKELELNEKYHNKVQIFSAMTEALIHSLPQMLWISLPLLALVLKLMYIRRKQFYYVSHIIFSIHLYIFLFIAQLILLCISKLNKSLDLDFLSFAPLIIVPGMIVYEYLALKNFYRQGWIKTFFKFLLINISYIIMLVVLFAFFGVFSFFKI
jgi:hypothetical protein